MSNLFSIRSFIYFFTVAILSVGCAKHTNPFASKEEVRAASRIGDSFVVYQPKASDRPKIQIKRSALDKEFLLRANLVPQPVAAMGTGLKSRVVAFTKKDGRLFMLEATQGHVVTNQLSQTLILAAFPILSEDEDTISFDFNEGMSRLFIQTDWHAHDYEGSNYRPNFSTMPVRISYLEKAKVEKNNELNIRQIAQVGSEGSDAQMIEVRYYLSPYRPDADYKPTVSKDFKQTGYFEVSPQLTSHGTSVVLATKLNHNKPIVFAVSSNTPKEYREAVKQGILYWNRAFENDPISVVDAPKGVTAPDKNYNVAQWVSYDRAGFAYADAQMDPRTGQILNAQTYLTSAFAFSGKVKARQLLNRIKSAGEQREANVISLAGLRAPHLCRYDALKALETTLTNLLASDAEDEVYLRVSQDYVRLVTAHEIGHLMGLRHNFAGSLSTQNYPLSERSSIFHKYLTEKDVPKEVHTSSSVMDYLDFQEDVLAGHQIAHTDQMMEYDRKAIEVLYLGKEYKLGEVPLFCTDSNTFTFVDCNRFDYGSSMVEFAEAQTKQRLASLAYNLAEAYVAAKAPSPGNLPTPVETISFDPARTAKTLLAARSDLVNSFGSSNHFLAIYRQFPFVSALNMEMVREKELEYLAKETDKLGGLEEVFSPIKASYYAEAKEKFNTLIESEHYAKGTGLAGQAYEFSEKESEAMEGTVALLFEKLPKAVTKIDLEVLGEMPDGWKNLDHQLGEDLADLLGKRTQEYLIQGTGKFIEVEAEVPVAPKPGERPVPTDKVELKKVSLKLPVFFYEAETRTKAAGLLTPVDDAKSIDWGFDQRRDAKKKFLDLLNESCDCQMQSLSTDKVKIASDNMDTKRAATRWFLENKKILSELK